MYRRLEAVRHLAPDAEMMAPEDLPASSSADVVLTRSGTDLLIVSSLAAGAKDLLWGPRRLEVSRLWPDGRARFGLLADGTVQVDLAFRFFDSDGVALTSVTRKAGANHEFVMPEGAVQVAVGFTMRGGGRTTVRAVLLDRWPFEPATELVGNDVLVLTDNYPSYENIYRYGFVHARVRRYRDAGLGVDVFRLRIDDSAEHHEFEGVEIATGTPAALRAMLASGQHRAVAVHFLSPTMWEVLKDFTDSVQITVWVHGAEIQPWHRRSFNHRTDGEVEAAKQVSEARTAFWQEVMTTARPACASSSSPASSPKR